MPNAKPPAPSESQLQESIVSYLRLFCPAVLVWSVPNAAVFMGLISRFVGKERAKKILSDFCLYQWKHGLLSGCPDLELSWGDGQSVFWELKTEDGVTSDKQDHVHLELRKRGREVEIIRSLEEARASIKNHGIPNREPK